MHTYGNLKICAVVFTLVGNTVFAASTTLEDTSVMEASRVVSTSAGSDALAAGETINRAGFAVIADYVLNPLYGLYTAYWSVPWAHYTVHTRAATVDRYLDALCILWKSPLPEDKVNASAGFRALAENASQAPRQWTAAQFRLKKLWSSNLPEDRDLARITFRRIAEISTHAYYAEALCKLYTSDLLEDKAIGLAGFRMLVAHNPTHIYWKVGYALWESSVPEEKDMGRRIFRAYAENPQVPVDLYRAGMIIKLCQSDLPEDQAIGLAACEKIGRDKDFQAASSFIMATRLKAADHYLKCDKEFYVYVIASALNPSDGDHGASLCALWKSKLPGNREIAHAGFKALAQKPSHRYHEQALSMLWHSPLPGDKDIAMAGYRRVATTRLPSDDFHWHALERLSQSDLSEDKEIALARFRELAANPTYKFHGQALSALRSWPKVETMEYPI